MPGKGYSSHTNHVTHISQPTVDPETNPYLYPVTLPLVGWNSADNKSQLANEALCTVCVEMGEISYS